MNFHAVSEKRVGTFNWTSSFRWSEVFGTARCRIQPRRWRARARVSSARGGPTNDRGFRVARNRWSRATDHPVAHASLSRWRPWLASLVSFAVCSPSNRTTAQIRQLTVSRPFVAFVVGGMRALWFGSWPKARWALCVVLLAFASLLYLFPGERFELALTIATGIGRAPLQQRIDELEARAIRHRTLSDADRAFLVDFYRRSRLAESSSSLLVRRGA